MKTSFPGSTLIYLTTLTNFTHLGKKYLIWVNKFVNKYCPKQEGVNSPCWPLHHLFNTCWSTMVENETVVKWKIIFFITSIFLLFYWCKIASFKGIGPFYYPYEMKKSWKTSSTYYIKICQNFKLLSFVTFLFLHHFFPQPFWFLLMETGPNNKFSSFCQHRSILITQILGMQFSSMVRQHFLNWAYDFIIFPFRKTPAGTPNTLTYGFILHCIWIEHWISLKVCSYTIF